MSQDLAEKIRAAAQAKNIDPDIALAIAKAESAMRPSAQAKTSSAGGLFQVVDKTWKEFGGNPDKKLDADENIRVGTDIIAKNTQTLRNLLQRDPRPAEVYAAHYFGPAGAKNFLSADPATPIVDILGKKAVKANPNLQGKTAAQVMAQLEKKMGGPRQPDVSRETSAPVQRKPLPPSLPPMAATEESSAPPSRMASLGPGYQAALALSFLSGADDKEDKDDEDDRPREPGVAEKFLAQMQQAPRPAALAEFADISIKSPFAALQPEQPQMLADGGEVGEESMPDVGRPTVQETYMAKTMFPDLPVAEAVYLIRGGQRQSTSQGEMLMGNLGVRVPLGKNADAMLMLAGSRPERNMSESKALLAAFNKRVGDEGDLNLNVVRPLDAPPGIFAGGVSSSYPLGEGRISGSVNALKLPGQDPRITGYGVGYGGRVGPGNLSAGIMKQKDGPYSGQIEYRLPIGRADGGEVERLQGEARELDSYQALEKYLQSRDEMPGVKITTRMPEGTDGLYTSDNLNIGSGTIKINKNTPKAALASLLVHETTHAADRQMKQQAIEQGMFGKSNQYTEAYEKLVGPEGRNRTALARRLKPEWAAENRLYRADPKEIAAHGVGAFAGPTLQDRGPRHVDATAATEFRILMDLAQRNVDKGPTGLEKIPAFFRKMGRYSDGGDVTAEEIAAASKPAFLTPKSGIGRKISTKPGELEAAALQGVTEAPYLLAGAPVDLATMVMRPFGYDVEKPMFGSEDLKERALKAGIRQKPPEGKAARALYEMTQAGASAVNPAAPVRGAVKAAEKTGEAAKMLARDFQQYNRQLDVPGASYAVRNKATPFVMTDRPDTSVDGFIMSMNRPETLAFREKYPDINFFDEAAMKTTQEYQNFTKPIDQAEYLVKYGMQGNYEQREMLKQDPTLEKWFSKAVPHYLRTDFATPEDPLVKAAEKGLLLHLEPKVLPRNFNPNAVEDPIDLQSLAYTRETEQFPASGMAKADKTNFAKRVEDKIDSSVYPATLGDISNPAQIPPSLRKFVETRPEERVMEFAPSVLGQLRLPELRDKMLEIRALGSFSYNGTNRVVMPKGEYSAYSQPAVKVPDEFLLPDKTLAMMNMATASNRVARFTRWEDETRQGMATTALRTDPRFERQSLQDGKFLAVVLPDPGKNPELKKLVTDVGCDGGWCTRGEKFAMDYGSGDSRLHVIVSGEGKQARPAAQFAVETQNDIVQRGSSNGVPFQIPNVSITEIKTAGNTRNFKGEEHRDSLPAIQQYVQALDKQYGGLAFVDQLEEIGLTQLPKNARELLTVGRTSPANTEAIVKVFGSEQTGMFEIKKEVVKLNNGSQYVVGNEDDIAELVRKATRNVLTPQQRATGGMIERQSTDNRRYL